MKILVGPSMEQRGKGRLDFCNCGEMEILRISIHHCDTGHPKDECGCRRSLIGISSDKGTTIAVVKEMNIDVIIKCILDCCPIAFTSPTHPLSIDKRRETKFLEIFNDVVTLSRYVQDEEEGTRICVEFPQKGSMDVREAGGILNSDYGI